MRERIKQQTHTADVQWHLEWSGNATWEHRAGTFHDTDFHAYLEKQGIEREPEKEWFKISGEESHQQFYRFRDTDGVLDAHGAASYTLRDEQRRAVEQTGAFARAHWDEGGAHGGEFLWNAKPRFGKTLTAYDLCRSIGAQKVLIVTNRPAIANSWYDDYVKFVGVEGGYRFISGVEALAGKPYCLSREEYLHALRNDPEGPKGFIEFVSLQDLKGSIRFGGMYQKLDEVADLTWDVLIIDEAHEGGDTFKTDVAFDHIKRRFTLHLSGTPFKAIANEKFADDAIYNWTYADEQQAKRDWPDDSEQPNPYANLPRLNLLTYQMSDVVEQEARGGMKIDGEQTEFAFDLNEFFSTKQNGGFVHDADVDKFLDALTTQEKFPFSTPELRDELRHTFWMLNRVDSARALAKKLQDHPVFGDYEVVLAAGDGKIDRRREREVARQGSPRNQGARQNHHAVGRPAHHGRDRARVDRRAHALEHGEPRTVHAGGLPQPEPVPVRPGRRQLRAQGERLRLRLRPGAHAHHLRAVRQRPVRRDRARRRRCGDARAPHPPAAELLPRLGRGR